jgi:hypothetical protein
MTEIDKAAEIDIVLNGRGATVRIPLTGSAGQDWCLRYQELARARNLPARAEASQERTWIVLDMPGYTGQDEAAGWLDAARELVGATDAAAEAPDAGRIEQTARDWWARQRT